MARTAKHDWDSIRTAHVEQGTPLKALAAQHGVNDGTLRSRASAEDWAQLRRLYLARIERARQSERADHMAREASDFDQLAFRTAKAAMGLATRALNELNRAAAEWTKADQLQAALPPPPDATAPAAAVLAGAAHNERARSLALQLERIGRAATAWHRLAHDALGDVPTARVEVDDAPAAVQAARSAIEERLDALTREERQRLADLAARAGGVNLIALLDRTGGDAAAPRRN